MSLGHPPELDGGVVAAASTLAGSSASLSVVSGLRRISVVCAGVAAALAVVVLFGWTLHIEILKRLLPGLPSMKANTAVCFLLASCSLIAYRRSVPRSALRRVAAVGSAVVVLVGVVTLAEYAFGVRLGFDQLLFHDRAGPNAPYPGRPAANTALGFVLVGGALLCWEVRLRGWRVSNVLSWPAAMLGFLALSGYATGAASLIALPARQAIALSSAVALSVLSLGVLLARSDRGWVAVLVSDSQTGVILRRLLPAAVALPAGLATLTLAGQRLGVFSTTFGVWLFVIAVTLAFMAVAWLTAAATQSADRTRQEAAQAAARLAAIIDSSDDAIIGKTLEGQITSWNQAAERIYGYSAAEAIGNHVSMLLPAGCENELAGLFARVAAGARVSHLEAISRREDGRLIDVSVTVSPIRDASGRVIGASTIARDITERKRAERELARLAEAAEYGSDAVISIDLEQRVRHWNHGAERLYGYSALEAIGRDLRELTVFAEEPSETLARMLAGGPAYQYETRRRRKDGTIVEVLLTISPWHVDGRVVGVTGISVDISERKRVERAREKALAELHQAQRVAKLGSWSWDPAEQQASWSAQLYEIFGRDPAYGPPSGKALLMYVHPEDRERVGAGYAQMSAGDCVVELDYRIVVDGAERTLHMLAHANPVGEVGYVGTVQDVSKTRAAERALRAAEERFRRAFEGAPTGMALLSLDGRLEQVNAALAALYGCTRQQLEGARLSKLLHPADVELATEQLRALARGEQERVTVELRIMSAAGSPVDVMVHASALRYGNGEPPRLLCQVQDITERKRFESELQFMADHDPLTGLLNRRKFEAELDRHIAHVKRYGSRGALLVLDIDHFKIVNDTLGHNAGDELIVSIASVLHARLRQSDVLARLGGDEFAVLLPEADQAEAAQVAATLVSAVRTNTALLGGEPKKVTTSIGVAMFDTSSEELSSETALIEADLAMYDAKEAGRDGHAFYTTSEHRTSRTKARLTWVARIEQALANDRFALLAQPILDLHAGEVRQHELLLRMRDEHDDLVPPAAFLYIAERFGLIAKLDEWVLTHAIELIQQHPELQLEVNISGRSLGDQALLQTIDQHLHTSQIDPTHLIFEVTETAAVANITHARTFTRHLRDRGCRFALDDFGAGFGSFYYLKHLPFDYVKIDGEFIRHATTGRIDQLVIDAVVHIAQGLGKETIAEFVTNEKTKQMVARLGVDYAQGYHIGKPIPIPELLDIHTPTHTPTNLTN